MPNPTTAWLESKGWKAFPFQKTVWKEMKQGHSGLLHATTGSGKTLAVWLGALQAFSDVNEPLSVLWVTPMRALSHDTLLALQDAASVLAPKWTLAARTGDTTSSERASQQRRWPTGLVTTPESLSLMLSRADAPDILKRVRLVVVDEWHELLGTKRGVQLQLALARLRRWNPALLTWGLSATLANLDEARDTLAPGAVIVRGAQDKKIFIDTLLPERIERFAWAGHMGLEMLPGVIERVDAAANSLVFTNTRSQCERWFQAMLDARPDWAGLIALHHGSVDAEMRRWVEAAMKAGQLKCVVCTASLDLGVDFLPVEQVLQIGSAKGVARLLQRAGRSGHAPGRRSRVTMVPTHSLEIVEASALRAAVEAGRIEPRRPPDAPLDVLVQHLVTIALGGGFRPEELLPEVRSAPSYRGLSDAAWAWALAFVRHGGETLRAYPDFQRVVPDDEGVWRVPDVRLARRHRSNIGTIVSDAVVSVQFMTGGRIATVEESFISRLRNGDVFLLGGRALELVRVEGLTAYVRVAKPGKAKLPRWDGGQFPISDTLSDAMLDRFAEAAEGRYTDKEMRFVAPLLKLQVEWSALPGPQRLLAEVMTSGDGHHLFLYPFAGRVVHLGLASLLAWRAGRDTPATFTMAINDYGLELLSATEIDWAGQLPKLLAPVERATLREEVLASLNASEMARRRFRQIARIAGLIFQSHPGEARSQRQLQASASLYFDVFRRHDPENRLLRQAEAELLSAELDVDALGRTLARMAAQTLDLQKPARPTPLAFPLLVERLRERASTESLAQRLSRMLVELEEAAGGRAPSQDVAARLVFGKAPEKAPRSRGRRRPR
ncbi:MULTISPECIES: ligase-associated DNA damage response DEXH box helicase [unclassified Roseateles]|uniref:ligase-associated DNA damage response DEXH box helicase n=1 Tax=unclassified Roseateles TaxID=2626991 RepID=UPI00070127D8|nr:MULTISPECIES: ligase-associated DNA damage response DEXH box helicase [unclassified Roseateles]KQW49966.1 DNA ligase-associated DEXH box helicase [Pelomonas sp. Root405]KRA67366.1 DNA ligase-associated DEXH box helicase [Pelomonas sp. Root662]